MCQTVAQGRMVSEERILAQILLVVIFTLILHIQVLWTNREWTFYLN